VSVNGGSKLISVLEVNPGKEKWKREGKKKKKRKEKRKEEVDPLATQCILVVVVVVEDIDSKWSLASVSFFLCLSSLFAVAVSLSIVRLVGF
jgi:hypothetical protein